jgi:hypothetical protein
VVDAMIVSVQPEGSIHVITEEKILKETNLKLADIELQNIEDLLEPQNAVKPN